MISTSQFGDGHWFSPKEIGRVVSPEYAAFLKEAGYVDIAKIRRGLFVADKCLRLESRVRRTARRHNVRYKVSFIEDDTNYDPECIRCKKEGGYSIRGNFDDEHDDRECYIREISHGDARKLVHGLGGRVLTTLLMYKLVIPKLICAAEKGNRHAELSEYHMQHEIVCEHLEDSFLDEDTLVIGTAQRKVKLPNSDSYGRGSFYERDLNDFGYPQSHLEMTANGWGSDSLVYQYDSPNRGYNPKGSIVLRKYSTPYFGLDLSHGHHDVREGFGVRFARFV